MEGIRLIALKQTLNRTVAVENKPNEAARAFASLVFNNRAMSAHLTARAHQNITAAINNGHKIDRNTADEIAIGMKNWALSKRATHYTHWFQPLTGNTAEKHHVFTESGGKGETLTRFNGRQLVQQEPDASSFPSGGIRNTFEARGYTAWDPSSPAFIYDNVLCIPTVFVSYTGEALDYKAPLIKALHTVDEAATEVVRYFDKKSSKVFTTLGWEQEFFLIDSALARARPDIVLAGRTLMGHSAAKGQQLEDHYFGSISNRVMAFLRDLEAQAITLGIPLKTRHNEVAPNQFEIAPLYEEANLAVDHNALLMDFMEKLAEKHHFKVLLHEKPFAGINGSGKHNNWSLKTDTGINLLSPGSTPMKNLQFLTFFINTIKAVNDNEELLRASFASAGNDLRLGNSEAPQNIISIFIGHQLTEVLNELEGVSKGKLSPKEKTELKLNVIGKIPEILLDNTDRNRTSPFAFTGNKFELRATGASDNSARSITVLSTMVAKQLIEFKKQVDQLIEKRKLKKDEAIFNVLREIIKSSKKIRYEGDGNDKNWQKEAKKRGLSNHNNTPDALEILTQPESVKLFEEMEVLNQTELKARQEIQLLDYTRRLQIEARVLGDISRNHIIPTAIRYQNTLIENVKGLKEIFGDEFKALAGKQLQLIREISIRVEKLNALLESMLHERKNANAISTVALRAGSYRDNVLPFFDKIRYCCDKLEMMVDDNLWPMVKYRELLFTR